MSATQYGQMTVTLTLASDNSIRNESENPFTANLLAIHEVLKEIASAPPMLEIFTLAFPDFINNSGNRSANWLLFTVTII